MNHIFFSFSFSTTIYTGIGRTAKCCFERSLFFVCRHRLCFCWLQLPITVWDFFVCERCSSVLLCFSPISLPINELAIILKSCSLTQSFSNTTNNLNNIWSNTFGETVYTKETTVYFFSPLTLPSLYSVLLLAWHSGLSRLTNIDIWTFYSANSCGNGFTTQLNYWTQNIHNVHSALAVEVVDPGIQCGAVMFTCFSSTLSPQLFWEYIFII